MSKAPPSMKELQAKLKKAYAATKKKEIKVIASAPKPIISKKVATQVSSKNKVKTLGKQKVAKKTQAKKTTSPVKKSKSPNYNSNYSVKSFNDAFNDNIF